jgi:putative endonuclease
MEKIYYTYIITNIRNTVFYTGITNNLQRRIQEHREKKIVGFTSKYNVSKLVWYETFPTPCEAITAEKRIKGWGRGKKSAMIIKINPLFKDLEILDSSQSSE